MTLNPSSYNCRNGRPGALASRCPTTSLESRITMADIPATLAAIAERIESDEDFAMRVGEDARAVLEAEGLPDEVVAAVLAEAEAEVVGFALPAEDAQLAVTRIAAAARVVQQRY